MLLILIYHHSHSLFFSLQNPLGSKLSFTSNRQFEKDDIVVFDFEDRKALNVVKLDEMVQAKRLKTEVAEPPPKMMRSMLKFNSVCIFDVHVISVPNDKDYLVQIGAIIPGLDGIGEDHEFLIPIEPDLNRKLTESQEKILNFETYENGYGLKSPIRNDLIVCFSEYAALKDFLDFLQEHGHPEIALYTTDLDIVMPILMSRLKEHDLVEEFSDKVKWLCDLKTIINTKSVFTKFKESWTKLDKLFEEIYDQKLPISCDDISADITAKFLMQISNEILQVENMNTCIELSEYVIPSKLRMTSVNAKNDENSKDIKYCSSMFDKILK